MHLKSVTTIGVLMLALAIITAVAGILFVVGGQVMVAKVLYTQVDQCSLSSGGMTIRLYQRGYNDDVSELVTAQQGSFFNEWGILQSKGKRVLESVSCDDGRVEFSTTPVRTLQPVTVEAIKTSLADDRIVLSWGRLSRGSATPRIDPYKVAVGGPLLFLSGLFALAGGGSLAWRRQDGCLRRFSCQQLTLFVLFVSGIGFCLLYAAISIVLNVAAGNPF